MSGAVRAVTEEPPVLQHAPRLRSRLLGAVRLLSGLITMEQSRGGVPTSLVTGSSKASLTAERLANARPRVRRVRRSVRGVRQEPDGSKYYQLEVPGEKPFVLGTVFGPARATLRAIVSEHLPSHAARTDLIFFEPREISDDRKPGATRGFCGRRSGAAHASVAPRSDPATRLATKTGTTGAAAAGPGDDRARGPPNGPAASR